MGNVDSLSCDLTFKPVYDSAPEYLKHGCNSLAIFALGYYLHIEDIEEFATASITEGGEDKKIDIFYLDLPERRALVAQSYLAAEWGKAGAPSNKASDLNTATTWLLSVDSSEVPPALRPRAVELRNAIREGEIDRIEFVYVHNCHESSKVNSELKAVADGARDKVRGIAGDRDTQIVIAHKEMGIESIEDLYRSADKEILVEGWLDLPRAKYFEQNGIAWRAILTSVPASWLQALHKEHGARLFSANYRDYLGQSRHQGNINFEITQTAETEPANFWVFNNGVTALTHELAFGGSVRLRGISIINGAQTTGSLSEASGAQAAEVQVPFRLVQCADRELIDKIIRNNNTQNDLRPSDRRSSDSTQKRLGREFAVSGVNYVHRRSGPRLPSNAVTAEGIAPALCSFHGDPQTAFRNSRNIFLDDTIYERTFPRSLTVGHVFLVRSLSQAIDYVKSELKAKRQGETATGLEDKQFEVLKYSASKHFIFFLLGSAAEEIMGRKVSDLSNWKANTGVIRPDNHSLKDAWVACLHAILPILATLIESEGADSFYEVPRSKEKSRKISSNLKALLASLESTLAPQFDDLRTSTAI